MKKSLVALALTAGLLSSACLGSNNAFNNIQNWNRDMSDNKWVRQGVSFGFWIIPVYPICLLADILLFNSIEYWGGDNPINAGD